MVLLRKRNHLASVFLCDIQRVVGTLHVAYNNLVELLYRLQHLAQITLSVIRIDYNRNAVVCIHDCKGSER